MQKIILTLLFCSVVSMANNEQNDDNQMKGILTKTLKEVKNFKTEKNQEIKALRVEISLLKNKLKASKSKEKKELQKVKKKLNSSQSKQKRELQKVKKKLNLSQKEVITYKKAQVKANRQLKKDKKIIKDLHFMIKHKNEVMMDEYALGRYYFNL